MDGLNGLCVVLFGRHERSGNQVELKGEYKGGQMDTRREKTDFKTTNEREQAVPCHILGTVSKAPGSGQTARRARSVNPMDCHATNMFGLAWTLVAEKLEDGLQWRYVPDLLLDGARMKAIAKDRHFSVGVDELSSR